jgi:hypothetical protein
MRGLSGGPSGGKYKSYKDFAQTHKYFIKITGKYTGQKDESLEVK